jgi:hypothetical protein
VAVAEEKRPTPGKRRKEKLTQRIIQTAKKCLGLLIGNHDTREPPMMTSLTSFFSDLICREIVIHFLSFKVLV